ncbi:prepilin-type N-terminal cleavage/methylation domain-containing protein [Photobacterium kishitanii]|uniref:PilW family protein n=1 Tax=Photobacterium kishitanii TaxID=318456 RepID=UPI00043638F5|nr:prepilin-type N-terminal cleavage/methylation domain-containing protein [Photobacterium kishitanii]OBU19670.1 pilus assembly protein PilW [Photobacterium kishitanii]PSU93958.1 prepilin-type N-terminal cleavage/methylation domain-containing protein [Photobacterium kishitanii]PSV24976.1 prepilin-type N-terminal cleavage/methylation domain-containing protein [Photobacterium kishitanii]PSW69131.1 prepilin-type N-terminal cleavage/methylation domain-containing protein [Photobacterium kishitanii]
MRNANQGFSLIELLIASSVGLIAIAVVGSVFLSGYQASNKRSLELLLQQDVNDAFRLIKEDVLRAGYVSGGRSSLKISGADNVVYVNVTNNCLAYVYDATDGRKYNEFIYNDKDKKLVYRSSNDEITVLNACSLSRSRSYSLIYDKQISVDKFGILNKPISSASATSQLIKITLAAHLNNDIAVSTAKSIQIKTRNWQ